MNQSDIEKAALKIVERKVKAGEIVEMKWAVHELIASMGEVYGDGADFHVLAADYYAWRIVKKTVKKYDAATSAITSAQQMDLAGFDKMQEAYTVERSGSIMLVPVEQMTFQERDDRATLYESHADALRKHAKELRAFNEAKAVSLAHLN